MSPDWASNPVTIPFANIYDPQSLNLYSYTGNNPLSRFDPNGHLDCSGGATQDVACAVTTAAKAVWNWLSGSGDSSSSSNGNSQTASSSPDSGFHVTSIIRYAGISAGVTGEVGGGPQHFGLGYQGSIAGYHDFADKRNYTTATSGYMDSANLVSDRSPDPKDWILGAYAGFSGGFTFGNGSVQNQDHTTSRTASVNGRLGWPWGINYNYSYSGTLWKPGVYQMTISPPFAGAGFIGSVSNYSTTTDLNSGR